MVEKHWDIAARYREAADGDRWASASSDSDSSSDQGTRGWFAAAVHHRARVVGYIFRTTREPSEVDDLLAETMANA